MYRGKCGHRSKKEVGSAGETCAPRGTRVYKVVFRVYLKTGNMTNGEGFSA